VISGRSPNFLMDGLPGAIPLGYIPRVENLAAGWKGDIMKTTHVFVFLAWLLASGVVSTSDVKAADLQYDGRARVVTRSVGCGWRHTCCPDRYTCSSLYGAYGPFGGTAYWTRYTYGGWGYVR
jgi:hypothetical protein